jgi:hypothetical protein
LSLFEGQSGVEGGAADSGGKPAWLDQSLVETWQQAHGNGLGQGRNGPIMLLNPVLHLVKFKKERMATSHWAIRKRSNPGRRLGNELLELLYCFVAIFLWIGLTGVVLRIRLRIT